MPKDVTKAKIACLNFSLQKMKLPLGISVVVQDPDKLQAIRDRCVCVCVCGCGCVGGCVGGWVWVYTCVVWVCGCLFHKRMRSLCIVHGSVVGPMITHHAPL